MAQTRKGGSRGIEWQKKPDDENYPAALSFLTLTFPPKQAAKLVKELRDTDVDEYKAKDIFRASGLSLLGVSNSHVERDLKKIRAGKALSPLLLVRLPGLGKVLIADGYHRLCAVYSLDEDAVVPCKVT
jgi:hypothetical protein